jgi:cullin 2
MDGGHLFVLVELFQEHIKQQGLKVVTNINTASEFVEDLFGIYNKYKGMVQSAFSNEPQFRSGFDKAFTSVVNHCLEQPYKSQELLAKYCDALLKKSAKDTNEAQVENLEYCVNIFQYLDEKDVFLQFYCTLLAKRLMHQPSHSMDAEETMMSRLKQVCDFEFNFTKLHRMFTDMSVSSDLTNKFCNTLKGRNEVGLNLSILQSGAWPSVQSFQAVDFAVPQELDRSVKRFEDFYRTQFKDRKLFWLHSMSTVELEVHCFKKPYTITMQAPQMALFAMFQKRNSITCLELQSATQLDAASFETYLQSLVDSKLLIVSCNEIGCFLPSTAVALNLDFINELTEFKLPFVEVNLETFQETEQILGFVREDRIIFLQVHVPFF